MNQEIKNTNNYVELRGYLCKDIALTKTKNGKTEANMMLNVWKGKTAEGKNEYMTTFVKAYGEHAEAFASEFKKDQLVGIVGVHSTSFDDEYGYNKSIIANQMYQAENLTKEDMGNGNISILQGFVCKDIELGETKNGKPVANIMLNVKQGKTKGEDGVEKDKYAPVFLKAYGDKAVEFAEQFKKSSLVEVRGRLSTYYDKDKQTHAYNEDIIVNSITKLEKQAKKETVQTEEKAAVKQPEKEATTKAPEVAAAKASGKAKKKEPEAER